MRELFDAAPPPPPKKTRAELMKDVDSRFETLLIWTRLINVAKKQTMFFNDDLGSFI